MERTTYERIVGLLEREHDFKPTKFLGYYKRSYYFLFEDNVFRVRFRFGHCFIQEEHHSDAAPLNTDLWDTVAYYSPKQVELGEIWNVKFKQ